MNAPAAPSRAGRWIAIAASLVVLAAIVAAIAVMGSPSRQRLMRLDERRVDDLQAISTQVQAYRNEHGRTPASLAILESEPGVRVPHDPASGQPYGYEVVGETAFRLCARFDTDSSDSTEPQPWMRSGWVHGAGRQCFKRQADNVRE